MHKTCEKNESNVNNNLSYISVIQERISAAENFQHYFTVVKSLRLRKIA